jgi:hypothetical protein
MRWISIAMCALVAACGGSGVGDDGSGDTGDTGDIGGDDDSTGNAGVFDSAVTRVQVEIDREMGADPYTGPVVGGIGGDTFDLLLANLDRVFSGTKTLDVPTTLADMEPIGTIADEELTVTDILTIAGMHRQLEDSATVKTYYVVFVTGHFADDGGVRTGVLGVSIGNTGVVAMFKDVIETTQGAIPNVERYVEQSTLIHELGHAIGLVGNGVATIAAHRDDEHGAHCTNDQCVMYWLNEGASDMAQWAQTYVLSGSSILFDDDCLADVDALTH